MVRMVFLSFSRMSGAEIGNLCVSLQSGAGAFCSVVRCNVYGGYGDEAVYPPTVSVPD